MQKGMRAHLGDHEGLLRGLSGGRERDRQGRRAGGSGRDVGLVLVVVSEAAVRHWRNDARS